MKKKLLTLALYVSSFFFVFGTVNAVTPVSWDGAGGLLQPLATFRDSTVKGARFQATSTSASIFPYASTTVTSATTFCISTDCISAWTSGLSGSGIVPQVAYFTGTSALGSVATGTLAVPTGLTVTANRYVLGGNATIALDTGYVIPLQSTLDAKALAATTLTVAGTANQVTSSAGAQDLSSNRTWTLSLPSHVIFPGNFFANNSTTTNATTTGAVYFTGVGSLGGLSIDGNGKIYSSATTTAGTGLTYSGNAFNVNSSQSIATLSNLTNNGFVMTSGGTGALSIQTLPCSIAQGCTGLTSLSANSILYSNSAGTGLLQVATSTLNLGVSGGGTGAVSLTGILLGNGTSAFTGLTTSAGIFGAISDETGGSGVLVGNASPTFTGLTTHANASTTENQSAGFLEVGKTATTTITTDGKVGIASSSPAFRFSVGTAGSDFYVNSTGKAVGYDTANAWNGRLSPTRSFVLGTATTTTWTASTTASAYLPFLVMPFAGTIQQTRCVTDASFVGVNVQIAGSNVTPSYFVASTTTGVEKFTAGNTFTAGQKVSADFGTTTTATTKSVACTFDVTETP